MVWSTSVPPSKSGDKLDPVLNIAACGGHNSEDSDTDLEEVCGIREPRYYDDINLSCQFDIITSSCHYDIITLSCQFDTITLSCHYDAITPSCHYGVIFIVF